MRKMLISIATFAVLVFLVVIFHNGVKNSPQNIYTKDQNNGTVSNEAYAAKPEEASEILDKEEKNLLSGTDDDVKESNMRKKVYTYMDYDVIDEYELRELYFRTFGHEDFDRTSGLNFYNSLRERWGEPPIQLASISTKVMRESLKTGYDLLPGYLGLTDVYSNIYTKEFKELNDRYRERFGDGLPVLSIPGNMETLTELVNKSLEQDKDLLNDSYGWDKIAARRRLSEEWDEEYDRLCKLYEKYTGEIIEAYNTSGYEQAHNIHNMIEARKSQLPEEQWQELHDKVCELDDMLDRWPDNETATEIRDMLGFEKLH